MAILRYWRYFAPDSMTEPSCEQALMSAIWCQENGDIYPESIEVGGKVVFTQAELVKAYGDYFESEPDNGTSPAFQVWLARAKQADTAMPQ